VVSKRRAPTRTSVVEVARPTKEPEFTEKAQEILWEVLKCLVFKHGHLLVATGIREERGRGSRRWIMLLSAIQERPIQGLEL
jgi:hypothetical protein